MTTTMSSGESGYAAWCHCSSTDLGGGAEDFLGLFGDRQSSPDDLFEMVWRGTAGGGTEGQPSCSALSSLPRPAAVALVPVPERLLPPPPAAPPSEAEMASWLFPIISAGGGGAGQHACVDDDQTVPSGSGNKESSDHKLQGKRKTSSNHAEAHSLTEKRRRCKIREKLKALQQLVPGCDDKSNQASTLDQTIRYMKSLQQHIQAMSSYRCRMKSTSLAVYPVVQQVPSLPCWWRGTSVQGWLLGGPQVPFCAHVSMGSSSPPCSHDV